MPTGMEYRTSFDVRATDDVDGFEGHAASFWSVDSYGTVFSEGAFKRTIRGRVEKIPVLRNHDPDDPIGKHLELKEDKQGLYVNVGIADDGAEGTVFLKRLRFGVPFGLSFGFQTFKDRSAEDDDPIDMSTAPEWLGKGKEARKNVRVITEVKLWETSPVTFASNDHSTIDAIRSAHAEQQAELLTSLLEDMREGRLTMTDARIPLLRTVADAVRDLVDPDSDPEGGTTPLLEEELRRRNLDIDIQTTIARFVGLTGAHA